MIAVAKKWLWMAAGGVLLVLGLIGLVFPLLPGIPLLIIALLLLSQGSARVRHRVRDWHRRYRVRHSLVPTAGLTGLDRVRLFFWQAAKRVLDAIQPADEGAPRR